MVSALIVSAISNGFLIQISLAVKLNLHELS